MSKKKVVLVCSECESDDMEEKVWIDLNSREILTTRDSDKNDYWCNNCESFTGWPVTKKERKG